MHLNATVSASAFDEHYGMAFIYCFDKEKNYCFSLSRFPDEDEIEVMVLDQINQKVDGLSVRLEKKRLTVNLNRDAAEKLDRKTNYTINLLDFDEIELPSLHEALRKIFKDKQGLQLAC